MALEVGPLTLIDPADLVIEPDTEDLSAFFTDSNTQFDTIDTGLGGIADAISTAVGVGQFEFIDAQPILDNAGASLVDLGATDQIDGVADAAASVDGADALMLDAQDAIPADAYADPSQQVYVPPDVGPPDSGSELI